MFLCKPCLAKRKPEYKTHPSELMEGECDDCKASVTGLFVSDEVLGSGKTKPKMPAIPSTPPMALGVSKAECKHLVVDWESNGQCWFCGNQGNLVEVIAEVSFQRGHKDIGVYKLEPLEHRAEIKIDVGNKKLRRGKNESK